MIEYEIIEQSTVIGQFLMATTTYDNVYTIHKTVFTMILRQLLP